MQNDILLLFLETKVTEMAQKVVWCKLMRIWCRNYQNALLLEVEVVFNWF